MCGDFVGLTERELAVVSCLAKHIRELVDDLKSKDDGWECLLKELDEIIRLADSGLASSLISKLNFRMVLRPGFEPGSAAREAAILDRAILPEPQNK